MEQQKPQRSPSEEHGQEVAPLKQLKEFQHFMHECQECQQEVEPHWQACAHCGARLATRCPACGTPLPPAGAQSCPHCGLEIPSVNG